MLPTLSRKKNKGLLQHLDQTDICQQGGHTCVGAHGDDWPVIKMLGTENMYAAC